MKDLCVVVSNNNENVTPYETIDAIKKAGFKYVFIQWYEGEYKKFDISQEEQLKYARKQGLEVLFAHLGYRDINDIWKEDIDNNNGDLLVEKYKKNLLEMKNNNINLVVMHPCSGYDAPKVNLTGLKRFKEICEYAKSLGINVAFENTKIDGYQQFLLDNLNLDNVSICFDSGHMHCHFKDKYDFKYFKNKISCIHIHDNHGESDEHLIPYDGNLDMNLVLNGLRDANYKGYFTLELCYRNSYTKMSIEEFYQKGHDVAKKILK